MTTPPGVPDEPRTSLPARATSTQVQRWLTLAGLVAVIVSMAVLGVRESSYGDLERGLVAGTARDVQVGWDLRPPDPGTPPPSADGTAAGPVQRATAEVYWRDGRLRRHCTVDLERLPGTEGLTLRWEGRHRSGTEQVHGPTLADALRRRFDVPVGAPPEWGGTYEASMAGWSMRGPGTGWVLLGVLAVWGSGLVLLVAGPQPRYATRWAWFWLIVLPTGVLGLVAFLLLGMRGAVPGYKRVSGVWGFLLGLILP